MTHDPFIGTWRLVSAEYRYADGHVVEYLGANPLGVLTYDAFGNMAVQLMRRDRPAFASGDRLGGALNEIKAAFEGYHAYFGTFTVDEKAGIVTHHIQGCSFPNWVGVDQKRFFDLEGNRLNLRTPPLLMHGDQAVGYLIWEGTKE